MQYFVDEVKALPKSYTKPEVSEQELNMAKTMISLMDVPFDAAAYHDEYQQKLRAMIEAKIQGREVAGEAPEPNNVINLSGRAQGQHREATGAPGRCT